MPRNIEIKAPLADVAAAREICTRLGARACGVERQTDRYYALDAARRVKLRTIQGRGAELIEYCRPETAAVRPSDYSITPVRDPAAGRCLVPAGPPLVVVRKRREVLRWRSVRIHLDAVEGLGTFLELEAVVGAESDEVACRAQVAELMQALGLREMDLIAASYADLMRARGGNEAPPGS